MSNQNGTNGTEEIHMTATRPHGRTTVIEHCLSLDTSHSKGMGALYKKLLHFTYSCNKLIFLTAFWIDLNNKRCGIRMGGEQKDAAADTGSYGWSIIIWSGKQFRPSLALSFHVYLSSDRYISITHLRLLSRSHIAVQ